MKKLIFGLSLLASIAISNSNTFAQTDPGLEGGEKWVCCQVTTREACTDMTGDGHYGTVKKPKC